MTPYITGKHHKTCERAVWIDEGEDGDIRAGNYMLRRHYCATPRCKGRVFRFVPRLIEPVPGEEDGSR